MARRRAIRRHQRIRSSTRSARTPGAIAITWSDSFNNDKPYDRFIQEQIAGDEMFPGDKEALIATGYLRAGSEHLVSGNIDPEESRQEVLTEIATNVGQTFLAMTVNCARCHNHKFDPILQADFYRAPGGVRRREGQGSRDRHAGREDRVGGGRRRLTRSGSKPVETALKELAKPFEEQLIEGTQDASSIRSCWKRSNMPKDKRTPEQKRLAKNAEAQIKPAWDEVVAIMPDDVKATRAKLREQLHEVEVDCAAIRCRTLTRSSTPARLRRKATCCGWAIRTTRSTRSSRPFPVCSTAGFEIPDGTGPADGVGQLAGVARESADRARDGESHLAVPHGRRPGAHAERFRHDGRQAATVTQPARLAGRGVHGRGWSVKAIDRLIVTSSAYRQSSAPDAAKAKIDPENRLFWRMNRKRLDGGDDPRRGAVRRGHAESASSAAGRCASRSSRRSTT